MPIADRRRRDRALHFAREPGVAFPRPSENDPPTTFPISQASMRLSTSDGLEGLSIVSANPAYSRPPPPNSTWVATTVAPPPQQHTSGPPDQQFFPPPPRESIDPFALRPAPPAAIVAPPDLLSTVPPVTKLQGYSDAPTDLPRVEVPLAPERHMAAWSSSPHCLPPLGGQRGLSWAPRPTLHAPHRGASPHGCRQAISKESPPSLEAGQVGDRSFDDNHPSDCAAGLQRRYGEPRSAGAGFRRGRARQSGGAARQGGGASQGRT